MSRPTNLSSRRRHHPTSNIKLRRLTQAYLSPYPQEKNAVEVQAVSRIDHIYSLTQSLILNYQSATSGLFPRYSKDRDVGYVKDSIYCAMACWACSDAYKRMDDERGRQTELRQSASKTMRGILFSWMQQADLLDKFKSNNSAEYALHARFDLQTGMCLPPCSDRHYGQLQMDLVALYLLALVQMTSAGAKIIYTHHEVNFVQNLVFYIERTYRTPDFGMWERGTRYNNGTPELQASSLGMVKAALEAINGFNVCGERGGSGSVIYVDIDGHNRNRTTFETILPRESNSKNTDASLLLTVGWPAFATHDSKLFDKTVKKCLNKLEGRFGVKRFLRDGYRTELEDGTRMFYDEHETAHFDAVECQFPIFLACAAITAILKNDKHMADKYWNKLQDLLVNDDTVPGGLVVPECYCVDELLMSRERAEPNSTDLYPISPQEFGHHLWSNAVYVILILIKEGMIHMGDLDPINRHLPASQRPKTANRHSAFQGSMEGDPVVQIALIAESSRLQMTLSTYGISSQTPHEVEPVQIWPSWRMVKVFECLGRDEKLRLSGRPARPFGPLSTSKVFRVFGDTILCYPLLFEVKDFYTNSDPAVLIDDIKRDIDFVSRRWKLAGRPTMCVVLREENLAGEYFDHVLNLLVQLKNGYVDGIRVRMGRVHQLLNLSCIEHVDFASSDEIDFDVGVLEESDGTAAVISRLSLKEASDDEGCCQETIFKMHDHDLREIVARDEVDRPKQLTFALRALWIRFGPEYYVNDMSIRERLEKVYRRCCQLRIWFLVRYCAGVLQKTMNSLAPAITNMLVRGKQVMLGVRAVREELVQRPMAPKELASMLFACCPHDKPHIPVLHQELIIACSNLISAHPNAFDGVLTIRLGWLTDAIQMMADYVKEGITTDGAAPLTPRTTGIPHAVATNNIYELSPTVIKGVVHALMTRKNWHLLTALQSRRLNGALNRMPINFYNRVWVVLERSREGIVIAAEYLPRQPTLSDMTEFELTFSYKIESMLSHIGHPEYRQLIVELLCILATIVERNPEISFSSGRLDCDVLIQHAFSLFAENEKLVDRTDMTPFYQLDAVSLTTSAATYLTRAVVDYVLSSRQVSRVINIFEGQKQKKENRDDPNCAMQ